MDDTPIWRLYVRLVLSVLAMVILGAAIVWALYVAVTYQPPRPEPVMQRTAIAMIHT